MQRQARKSYHFVNSKACGRIPHGEINAAPEGSVIIKSLVVGPYASNCYLVGSDSSREAILIDPGSAPERILAMAKEADLAIKLVVITHGHTDHIDGLKKIKNSTTAAVAVHTEDAEEVEEHLSGFKVSPRDPNLSPINLFLKDGDRLDVSDLHFVVIHTPGHSPGSICLLGNGVLFSGDTLFNYGIGRYDLPGGSYEKIMSSIRAKLMVLPDNTIVYPGHGPSTTIGKERKGNPFLGG
jgi:hydroxyacylglutathione hydrolase